MHASTRPWSLRWLPWLAAALGLALIAAGGPARSEAGGTMVDPFDQLSTHGNSACSAAFRDGIGSMPAIARLQGSCCSPMDRHRYLEQVAALTQYRDIAAIPPDPYDIAAGQAQQLMEYDALVLTPNEQRAYDYAVAHSDEKGPCCCQCWRWHVYGGLAKHLIRTHGFTGPEIVQVWNLSNGCGGADHQHG